jgi:hypothetical protein
MLALAAQIVNGTAKIGAAEALPGGEGTAPRADEY